MSYCTGLRMSWEQGQCVVMETDAADVVRMIKGHHDEDHPEIDLIMEFKSFLSRDSELNIC